ncbi:hypothetical protein CFP56_021055 [Quercus suber]|uniref:Ubiquitin-like domain-containing protein n=1 Tax=Quercus suber TaxID=58331 RepID=A0AAW0KE76_QUESU
MGNSSSMLTQYDIEEVQEHCNHTSGNSVTVPKAMYIRVKRSKTTYFIRCDPTETVLDIKEKLQVLIDQPVENDSVVALTLRKDDNEFEEVDIVRPNDFGQSRDADTGNW